MLNPAQVMNSIGVNRFAALVTDGAGNVRAGAKRVVAKHPTILDLGDPPHGINNAIKDICGLKYFAKVQCRSLCPHSLTSVR